ncbi:MAG TPA: XdhC family protein, partial [Steroidobacteraceae bacterium]
GPDNAWQPLAHLASAFTEHRPTAVGLVAESASAELKPGAVIVPAEGEANEIQAAVAAAAGDTGVGWIDFKPHQARIFVLPLTLPPRFLLLGAGPDAAPVVDFAAKLGWKVTIVDHRPAYAVAARFPGAERVVLSRPEALAESIDLTNFSAAVVMSHHLPSDLNYLRVLAGTTIPYVGLLGPAARREKLFAELGSDADRLRSRLHAPVGLAIGGRAPESVALAIVAEVHAFLHGRHGGAFSKE